MKPTLALLLLTLIAGGCRGKHHPAAVQNEEPEASFHIASSIKTNDPAAAPQLVKGFYGIEGNAWRWTAGHFSLRLRTPLAAAQRGATLKFALAVPDVVLKSVGTVKLTASAGGTELKTESYAKSGNYTFAADVPPSALTGDSVLIDFAMDKAMPPGPADGRELGVIASSASLEVK